MWLPPTIASSCGKHRATFWLATFVGLTGLPLLFLSSAPLPWYGLVASLALPVGCALFVTMLTMRADLRKEADDNKRRIVAEQQDPVRKLHQLIIEHRQKIIGRDSEFGLHLAKLEDRHSKTRINQAHWTRRNQAHPNSPLYAARLAAAERLSNRLGADIEVLLGKKQEIIADLDRLESRLPQIDSELEDWRRDRELQDLTDEEEQLSRETEEIARRTIFAFAKEMQKIAVGIEGLRLNIAGYTCDPRLIEATDEKAGEILEDTRATVASSNAATNG
jgi:chromosome segregation ATPase